MAPVHHEGRDGRDVLRGALAVLKEVRTARVVLLASSQARTVAVPLTSRTRHSASIGVSVEPRGSGFSTLPPGTVARSVPVLGHASLNSAVSSRPLMTVSQARDTLRWVGATPLQFSRGVSSTPTPSSTVSSTWTVPRSSQTTAPSCSHAGSTGPVPGSSQTRGLSCSGAGSTGSVLGSSQTRGLSCSGARSTTPLVPSRSTPGTGSVKSSQDTFPLEDMNNAEDWCVVLSAQQCPAVTLHYTTTTAKGDVFY